MPVAGSGCAEDDHCFGNAQGIHPMLIRSLAPARVIVHWGASHVREDTMGFLKPVAGMIYAGMRILAGLMFMSHGLQKIFGLFGGAPEGAPSFVVYGAGSIELVTGALIAIGLFAAPAAFLASGTMAFAFLLGHVMQKGSIIPIVNGGELAVLYCWAFFVIAAQGAGVWSVDGARSKA
jgi:putative oxidoreductase